MSSKKKDGGREAVSAPRPSLVALAALASLLLFEALAYGLFYLVKGMTPHALAARDFYPYEHHYMTDHPYLPYIAKPGRYGDMSFNSLGDRGPEPDRPKRRVRIVCYGGSTTFDASHVWDETWPGYLQHLLGAEKYEVINAAQNGATSADTLVNLALTHIDLKPDYVLVYQGNNDLESSFGEGFKSDYSHKRRTIGQISNPLFDALPRWLDYEPVTVAVRSAFTRPTGNLWNLYTRPGVKTNLKDGPFGLEVFRRNIRSIHALSKEYGAKVVLGTFVYYEPWAKKNMYTGFAEGWRRGISLHNSITREMASGDPSIRLAEIAGSFTPTLAHMLDFCHLTQAGNKLVAKSFYEAIRRFENLPANHPDLAAYEKLKTADLPRERLSVPRSSFPKNTAFGVGTRLTVTTRGKDFTGEIISQSSDTIVVEAYSRD